MKRLLLRALPTLLAVIVLVGCATSRIDWERRIGNYSFDQAVLELGPPDKSAKLSDGTLVAEWLTHRGGPAYYTPFYDPYYPLSAYDMPFPDRFLRLTFNTDGKLTTWQRINR